MKQAIVCLDLDGTLWENERIPASALYAVRKARENGHYVFANTGRSRASAWQSLKDLPLSGAVYSAGTEIWMYGERIEYHPFNTQQAHRIYDQLSALPLGLSVEGSDSVYSNARNREFLIGQAKGTPSQTTFSKLPDPAQMQMEDYAQIMKFSLCDLKEGMIDDLLEKEALEFTPFSIQPDDGRICGEITQKAFNKGSAFALIRQHIPTACCTIAFGDSKNDLSMFKAADTAVCMGNGVEEAKQAADWVTGRIEDDGLYQAFVRLGLIEDDFER